MTTQGILAIGECMVELAPQADGHFAMGFAGDTFNTAWYLHQLLPTAPVDYLTSVGTDALSGRMTDFIAAQGIGTGHIARLPGASVGLYLIQLAGAERSFAYWRSTSAARQLAQNADALRAGVGGAGLIYLSGITLAILPDTDREQLLAVLSDARATKARIAFDPNLRPALWPDGTTMRAWVSRLAGLADIVLPSFDDERAAFGDQTPALTARRYLGLGAGLVVVKNGAGEMLAVGHRETHRLVPPPLRAVVDTTAAGDSFNAGFLAAHLTGATVPQALSIGATVAAEVIAARGALVPLSARVRGMVGPAP